MLGNARSLINKYVDSGLRLLNDNLKKADEDIKLLSQSNQCDVLATHYNNGMQGLCGATGKGDGGVLAIGGGLLAGQLLLVFFQTFMLVASLMLMRTWSDEAGDDDDSDSDTENNKSSFLAGIQNDDASDGED